MFKFTLVLLSLFLIPKVYCVYSCPEGCATCREYYWKNGCYSCTSGYYFLSNNCYSCSSCQNRDKCSSCPDSSSSSNSSSTVIVIVAVVFPCVVILSIGCFIWRRCRNRAQAENLQRIAGQNHVVSPPSAVQLARDGHQISNAELKVNWIIADNRFLYSQNCSICLDSNVDLHTHCKHYFHPKCILEWLSKKQGDCPLCKTKNLFPAKVYCQNCYEKYYEADAKFIGAAIKQQKWKICSSCKDMAL